MTQYGKILSKISPTFYKIEQYYEYFQKHKLIIDYSYLTSAKISPINSSLYLPKKSNYYYFLVNNIFNFYPFWDKIGYKKAVLLVTNDKVREVAYLIYLDELIVNMIINKFSAENEREIEEFNDGDINLTNTFIALVGKDMYDTIRENIK